MKQGKELEVMFDSLCNMIEEATKIRDDALIDLDAKQQEVIDSVDYWDEDYMLVDAGKTIEKINDRREAVLDEFDKIEGKLFSMSSTRSGF